MPHAPGAGTLSIVLRRGTDIDQAGFAAECLLNVIGCPAQRSVDPGDKGRHRDARRLIGDRARLGQPFLPPAIQHRRVMVSIVLQCPPQPRGEHPIGIIISDDKRPFVDSQLAHQRREWFRRGDLHLGRAVAGDVSDPIDKHCTGDMSLGIGIMMTVVVRRWIAGQGDTATNIDNTDVGIVQMIFKPDGRDHRLWMQR